MEQMKNGGIDIAGITATVPGEQSLCGGGLNRAFFVRNARQLAGKFSDQFNSVERQTVELGLTELFKRELRVGIQQPFDPANPVRWLKKLRKIVRISTIGDAIVSV